jgi:hypothetical protein
VSTLVKVVLVGRGRVGDFPVPEKLGSTVDPEPLTSFYAIQNGGRTGLLLSGEMHMGFALFPEWV